MRPQESLVPSVVLGRISVVLTPEGYFLPLHRCPTQYLSQCQTGSQIQQWLSEGMLNSRIFQSEMDKYKKIVSKYFLGYRLSVIKVTFQIMQIKLNVIKMTLHFFTIIIYAIDKYLIILRKLLVDKQC